MKFCSEPLTNFHIGHDGRGSKIGGARPGHNTCEPHLNIHDEVKQNLIKEIITKLKQAYELKSFDKLVIVAPSKTLGAIRLKLGPTILGSVIAEINKDLTHDNNHELTAHVHRSLMEAQVG